MDNQPIVGLTHAEVTIKIIFARDACGDKCQLFTLNVSDDIFVTGCCHIEENQGKSVTCGC